MNRKELIKKVCETHHLSYRHSYEANAICTNKGVRIMSGVVVNEEYFIDGKTNDIFSISELSQYINLDSIGQLVVA